MHSLLPLPTQTCNELSTSGSSRREHAFPLPSPDKPSRLTRMFRWMSALPRVAVFMLGCGLLWLALAIAFSMVAVVIFAGEHGARLLGSSTAPRGPQSLTPRGS